MPISDKQLAANRRNALKSTGPVTPQGKRNTSRNATRHGFLANAIVIDGESREAFMELLTSLHKEFQSETPTERALVDNLAAAQWRRLRLWTMESAGMIREMRSQSATGSVEDSPTRAMRAASDPTSTLELIHRYEYLLDRQHHRALQALFRMRQEKIARTKQSPLAIENKEPAA